MESQSAKAPKMNGTDFGNTPGSKLGHKVGKSIVRDTDKLRSELNTPLTATSAGGFPVQVAPWNKNEAAFKEKVEIYRDLLKTDDFQKMRSGGVKVPFNIDSNEITGIYEQKRAAQMKLNWYTFLDNLMRAHNNSPDIVRYVREKAPEYFEERLALIDRDLELQRMAARLKLKRVPDTEEELKFLFGLATGAIVLPDKVAYDTSKYTNDENEKNIKRGFLSVKNRPMSSATVSGDIFNQFGVSGNPYARGGQSSGDPYTLVGKGQIAGVGEASAWSVGNLLQWGD